MRRKSIRVFHGLEKYLSQLGVAFALLWMVMSAITFSDSLCGPVIPYMVREFLIDESAVVMMLGFLGSAFNLVKTAANIPGALLGDRINRSIIVLSALALLPAAFLLLMFAGNPLWILGYYALLGIFYGICMPSLNAIVAGLIPERIRGTSFAIFNLSWIISGMVAPLLGGFLSERVSLRFPPTLSLILSSTTLVFFIAFRGILEAAALPNRPAEKREDTAKPFTQALLLLCGMQFFSGLGNGSLMPIITAFLMYIIGVSPAEMGLAFSLGWGIATALAQIPGGRLSDRFGFKPILISSTLAGIPLLMLLPFSKNLMQFILITAVACFIGNLSSPAFSAWIAKLMGEHGWSRGYGLTSASFSVGSIVGPIVGSFAWTIFEPNHLPPFALTAFFMLLTLPFLFALRESSK